MTINKGFLNFRLFDVTYFIVAVLVGSAAIKYVAPKLIYLLLSVYPMSSVVNVLGGQLGSALVLSIFLVLFRLIKKIPLNAYFINGEAREYILCATGVGALFCLFNGLAYLLKYPVAVWEIDYVHNTGGNVHLVYFTSGLIAPITEELTFRFVLPAAIIYLINLIARKDCRGLSSVNGITAFAVFLSSVAFALAHYGTRGFLDLAYFFVLGLWFGYWAVRTSGISVCIAGHSVAAMLAVLTIQFLH